MGIYIGKACRLYVNVVYKGQIGVADNSKLGSYGLRWVKWLKFRG